MVDGRIVWTVGSLFEGRIKTIFGTQQPRLNQQGETMKEYGFGLAVPKSVLNQVGAGQPGEIWSAIHEEAFTLYPSRQIPPAFAMKYKDGDTGIDDKGISLSQRKGYAGHLVFALTTSLPMKFFRWENGAYVQISDGIKCGDYVRVQVSVKAHAASGQGKPGLYLNPNAVLFLGYGEEIVNAPSAENIFGNQAPPVPAGASATPLAPQGMPAMPQMQQQTYGAPPMQPQQVQPNYGVLPPQHQPQQFQAAPSPQPTGMPPIPGYQP